MMISGKKTVAEGNFYGALETIKDRAKDDPVKVFKKAMDAVRPVLEVKSRRVGGATYQVPVEVRPNRRTSLASRAASTAEAIPMSGPFPGTRSGTVRAPRNACRSGSWY
jgi:ribosomal protein S7